MSLGVRKALSLLAFLIVTSNMSTQCVDACVDAAYPLKKALAVGTYAYITRYLSQKTVDLYMPKLAEPIEKLNQALFNSPTNETMVHPLHPVLMQINLSVALRTAFQVLLESQTNTARKEIAEGFKSAYNAGMDSLVVVETIQFALDIYKRRYAKTDIEEDHPYVAVQKPEEPYGIFAQSSSFIAGYILGSASFAYGLVLAQKLTKDVTLVPSSSPLNSIAKGTLFVNIIYNVGITLSSLAQKTFFLLLDKYEPYKQCGQKCEELFRLGGETSYLFTDVFPNYGKLDTAIAAYKKLK